jgi:hypothetical protein
VNTCDGLHTERITLINCLNCVIYLYMLLYSKIDIILCEPKELDGLEGL